MHFLDKRIQGICHELRRLSVVKKIELQNWQYKKGNFIFPDEAAAADEPFEPFDSKTMRWYGPDAHYWFKTDFTVPEELAGRKIYLHLKTQIDEWDDGKNPQFLIFLNGEPIQGIDMNHREVLLAEQASAGEHYEIELQAYTGTLHSEFHLICAVEDRNPEILGLFYDLAVPLEAFPRLEKEDRARMDMERVLNDAINLLDLRNPYDESFYSSVREARAYLAKALYEDLAGHNEVIASCIGHTHIDVAWWWTVAQTREKVARSFATVLKMMDEYPNYKFMSSQAALYQFLKERYPSLYERVKQRVAEGRWEVEGGMWVEADTNLSSGESLIRQFLHGKKFFKEEFGLDNKILWLPDVFGYSGALPQIMKECGIEYFMTTKLAWNQFNKMPYDTFNWRGIDGSEIFTHLITTLGVGQSVENFFTTYNGMLHPDALIGAWQRYQQKELNNDVLISYGYGDGGGGPTRRMMETSDRLECGLPGIPKVRQAFARQYFDELHERVKDHKRLSTWEGELYFEYHRGTLTSMGRNKRGNRKSEIAFMDTELFSILAKDKVEYPAEELDSLWKIVLLNQFHDILPGTSIHEVYEVTKKEYEHVLERNTALQEERLASIVESGSGLTIFNTSGFAKDDIVHLADIDVDGLEDEDGNHYPVQHTENGAYTFVKSIPSKGYLSLRKTDTVETDVDLHISEDGLAIETPFYSVQFDEQALLSRLFDKENDREVLAEGEKGNLLRMYEDKPIYYDNWDIDIFYTEKYWDLTEVSRMEWIEKGPVRATLVIERPANLSTIRQEISFYSDSRRIDFRSNVDWKLAQHLLKVHFPLNVHSDEATFEVQFGSLTRKTHKNTSWDIARFESGAHKWIDFSEGHYGVSLLNDCKYGHSVDGHTIALTLIKSGIEPNPVTDQEVHEFTYALWPHKGDWRIGKTVEEAIKLNQPMHVLDGTQEFGSFSLASIDKANIIIETIKQAEDGEGIIVRMYESEKALTKANLSWNLPFDTVEECNAIEEYKEVVQREGQEISLVFKPYEIKTLRIR